MQVMRNEHEGGNREREAMNANEYRKRRLSCRVEV